MIKHSARYAAGFADPTSTTGLQFHDFVGAVQSAQSGADVPAANSDSINNANHSIDNTDHVVGIADFFVIEDSANASNNNADYSIIEESANVSGDVHSIDQQHLVISGAADFTDVPGTSQGQGLIVETQYTNDGLNNNHLSGAFDHIDNLAGGFTNSTVDSAFSTPSGHSFDLPSAYPVGLPDVFSDARGGSHGGGGGGSGGGGGGSTTPAPYTTNSGTGVDIHVTYDNSVSNAPSGFTSVVEQVANFFASSLQDSTQHITMNIDVGYGEVDGMRMGRGAIGESVTNLQDVLYSDLTSAYSTSGLSLGSSVPAGNLYVSYAEAKALDITITNPQTVDGYVGFSSKSGIFDYNNADGVSGNQYDFYGTVAHEFSEVMGRILLVGSNINNAPSYMAYDFFHFSSPGVQDFSGNGGYFSNDQGTTNLADFNDPSNPLTAGGDAGDWANSGTSHSGGSIYDAFNAFGSPGEVAPVSHTDMLALQALGFDLHPALV
jgi:hypothetical protein